ncbi:MAG: Alpha N-terminal protein methyltransferase 1 [Bogoriella megaspora]|nr:MAG: Alpha N-terminal protein methyltransferase 1 [Bogoriella megaspora]
MSDSDNQFDLLAQEESDEKEPDESIDQDAAVEYWSTQTADVTGMLGGYPQVSRLDLQASANFLAKLRRRSKVYKISKKLGRTVDCGAGIGRVTLGFLSKVADIVDIVEPVEKFTQQISTGDDFKDLRDQGVLGEVYTIGLQGWKPSTTYDLIWIQWCLSQLTDNQAADLLRRICPFVHEGGWIAVKENITTRSSGKDIYDETDSSVTRTDEKLRVLFKEARLKLVATELQRGFPKDLYAVRMYALQPEEG